METQKLRKQLLTIANVLQAILNDLPDNELKPARNIVDRDNCPVCRLPFTDDDPIAQRGVHGRCYKRIQREGKLEEAELSGIILPKTHSGRPKSIDLNKIINPPQEPQKKSARNPKKQ